MPRDVLRTWTFACVVAGIALAGCKSAPDPTPAPRPIVRVNGEQFPSGVPAAAATADKPPPIERTLKSDPCAARLHAISGAMLEFYALHNRLPPTLQDLQSLQDLDQPLEFTCTESRQPYVYVPAGLQSPNDTRRIILHDPTPDRAGLRWAIVMQRPRGRQPAAMWVVSLTDPLFRAYTRAPAPANPLPKPPAP
ncbi:MAG: hypothetical protein JWN40_3408 [Phycisphaerales bacterium]|nr:hypothetical protein [Phycisphaerales bacterium]